METLPFVLYHLCPWILVAIWLYDMVVVAGAVRAVNADAAAAAVVAAVRLNHIQQYPHKLQYLDYHPCCHNVWLCSDPLNQIVMRPLMMLWQTKLWVLYIWKQNKRRTQTLQLAAKIGPLQIWCHDYQNRP